MVSKYNLTIPSTKKHDIEVEHRLKKEYPTTKLRMLFNVTQLQHLFLGHVKLLDTYLADIDERIKKLEDNNNG